MRVRVLREEEDSPASMAALRDYAITKKADALVVYQDLEYCLRWLSKVGARVGVRVSPHPNPDPTPNPNPNPNT